MRLPSCAIFGSLVCKCSVGVGVTGACLAVSCKRVELQAGAGDHDKVTFSRLGPEEANDGALTLPGTLQDSLALIQISQLLTALQNIATIALGLCSGASSRQIACYSPATALDTCLASSGAV